MGNKSQHCLEWHVTLQDEISETFHTTRDYLDLLNGFSLPTDNPLSHRLLVRNPCAISPTPRFLVTSLRRKKATKLFKKNPLPNCFKARPSLTTVKKFLFSLVVILPPNFESILENHYAEQSSISGSRFFPFTFFCSIIPAHLQHG